MWAQGNSGNVLVSIAKAQGYFDDLGVNVEEVPLDDGQLEAVVTGQVDIASNSGTWEPVQMIASGDDMAIIGGFMLTGCMPVIARDDQSWSSPEDFLGAKIADSKSRYSLYHSLVEEGHDALFRHRVVYDQQEHFTRFPGGHSDPWCSAVPYHLQGTSDFQTGFPDV